MNKKFWIIENSGSYILNDHALTPIIANAQRFSTRAKAREDKKKNNPRSCEKILHVEEVSGTYKIL